ncbi:MAG: hypothetical protein M3417_10145 [Actinomycetota bacterium]|nr:hypothetical protein [Actinomycetota bacterium]
MLPVGIAIMVASVALGVIALTLVAVMSPAARSAGRRTRIAMALADEEDAPTASRTRETATLGRPTGPDAPYDPEDEGTPYDPEEEGAPHYAGEEAGPYDPAEGDGPHPPATQDASRYPAEEAAAADPADPDMRNDPAEEDASSYATEIADAPRWVIVAVIVSGAGLLVGLLMVMIASIP